MCAERCRVLVDGVVLRRIIEMTEGWRLVLECLPYILKNRQLFCSAEQMEDELRSKRKCKVRCFLRCLLSSSTLTVF